MTMFFGHNADCFCFFLLLHLMLDIFQIHWYFGSARCKKHEQQKQYVFVALLQTPHKVLCKNQNGRFRGWFIEISMNYTGLCSQLLSFLRNCDVVCWEQSGFDCCKYVVKSRLITWERVQCTFRSSSNQWKRRQRHFSHFFLMKCENCQKVWLPF